MQILVSDGFAPHWPRKTQRQWENLRAALLQRSCRKHGFGWIWVKIAMKNRFGKDFAKKRMKSRFLNHNSEKQFLHGFERKRQGKGRFWIDLRRIGHAKGQRKWENVRLRCCSGVAESTVLDGCAPK